MNKERTTSAERKKEILEIKEYRPAKPTTPHKEKAQTFIVRVKLLLSNWSQGLATFKGFW